MFIHHKSVSIEYLPYYGGASGQYLEIKKDATGRITSENIVSEDKLGNEDTLKQNDNLLTRVLTANLQSLKTLSTNLLKLTAVGKNTGGLKNTEKVKFENMLKSLAESASNIIKLIDEVKDVEVLFKKKPALRKADDEADDSDYIAEEGVGIEASDDMEATLESSLGAGTVAEAKPIGLAVIGEHGLAAARPMATAVAATGIAIARPIGTAIAGVDPSALGINFQINHKHSTD